MGDSDTRTVDARLSPCWLTWIAATTGCLNALGVACDNADVAGQSGYAFQLCVHRELCPSGPTVFDWDTLPAGIRRLGRSTLCFSALGCASAESNPEHHRAASRAMFETARAEVSAGRPCVIWGAYLAEFAIVVGTDDEHYHVESIRGMSGKAQPPIRWDAIHPPGGLYLLAFPSELPRPADHGDHAALRQAVAIMQEARQHGSYATGLKAYDLWMESLFEKRVGNGFGNAYNAQCWSDARRLAHAFVHRMAARNDSPARPHLKSAAEALRRVATEMEQVATLFPFPGHVEQLHQAAVMRACDALATARQAEAEALDALRQALAAWDGEG